jgi:hypothetical protein
VRLAVAIGVAAIWAVGPASAQVTVVAAGDIACDPADGDYNGGLGTATRCRQRATSDLALALSPDAVLLLGDNQYEAGTLAAHNASFAPSWGRLGPKLRPAPGNHEYLTAGAAGYFTYFGAAAGQGHYAFDLGGWHFISLDANCAEAGGCFQVSPQETWLRQDLAAHAGVCTLAFWHQPRFSSGLHGDDAAYAPFWRALQEGGADVVLNGHDHEYERFALQDAAGAPDAARGLREFVVGTGGKELRPFARLSANSVRRLAHDFGVLRLRLRPGGYDWQFVTEQGTVADAGSAPCRGSEAESSLVLVDGRFRVSATWRSGGAQGEARPGPEATPSAGVLWFFDPSNWELLVKVIDGCALNGHYWLFASATTNVGFTLEAVDGHSGREYRLEQAPDAVMKPLQDTSAFPCD